jgi:CRP-like cAMP-binding protein
MPRARQYAAKSIVYFAGTADDHVFILKSGHLLSTGTDIETGEDTTKQIKPGEFFGVKSALGHFSREETIQVLDDSQVVELTVPEFEQLITSSDQLIIKMLKAFSNELRMLHRKTESILNSTCPLNRAGGMLEVAKSFYDDTEYKQCCDICDRLLALFPEAAEKNTVIALRKDAKMHEEKLPPRHRKKTEIADNAEAQSQFALPAFDRFAKQFESGDVIISEFENGDTFYLIRSGLVQSFKCVNSTKKNLDILKQGEFFGEMSILENIPRSATCTAMTKVDVLEFNKENFELLISSNPQMSIILLKLFCKRIYDQQRRFKVLCIADIPVRIADVILLFDEMNHRETVSEKKRTYNLTVPEIAHWAGIPVNIAYTEIKKYSDAHQIELFEDHITVANIADIRRIVETRVQLRRPS